MAKKKKGKESPKPAIRGTIEYREHGPFDAIYIPPQEKIAKKKKKHELN